VLLLLLLLLLASVPFFASVASEALPAVTAGKEERHGAIAFGTNHKGPVAAAADDGVAAPCESSSVEPLAEVGVPSAVAAAVAAASRTAATVSESAGSTATASIKRGPPFSSPG